MKEPGDHFDRTWSNIKITNIKWDTSEDAKVWAKLPDEVDVLDMDIDLSKYDPSKDLDYDDEFLDDVSEWLTSHYDFCHDGFDIVTNNFIITFQGAAMPLFIYGFYLFFHPSYLRCKYK